MADKQHQPMTDIDQQFWHLAEALMRQHTLLAEGTIMSSHCLRYDNDFIAMITRKTQRLVVKLSQARVAELIEQGAGLSFSPAKKVFREWVEIKSSDKRCWEQLLLEAIKHRKGG